MPDLVTHCSVAYFVKEISRKPEKTVLFYLGTILPDILTRSFYILHPGLYPIIMPFHTPLILTLICLLISYLFEERNRKIVFFALLSGVYLHIFLDILQRHLSHEYFLFFPFTRKTFEFSLLWSETWFYILPFLIAGVMINELRKSFRRRRK